MAEQQAAKRRKRIKFLVFASIPTVVCLVLLEVGLRLAGIPYTPQDLQRPVFVINGDTAQTRRMYSRQGLVVDQQFDPQKETDALRVAILGGSSVFFLNDAERLRKSLESRLNRKVEVINFGACGCGSDRVLLSAREAIELDADVLLIYSGHNEFISHSNPASYRDAWWLSRHSKLFQCVVPAWRPEPGRVYSAAEKDDVYEQFRSNLREIAELAKQAGVTLVWGTVASNLRLAPEVYVSDKYDTSELPQQPVTDFVAGSNLLKSRAFDEARLKFENAVAGSPRPMRATVRINEILREVAAERGVPLADVHQTIIDQSSDGVPGNDLFDDHCHLNPRGNEMLQDTFADSIVSALSPQK